MEILTKTEIKNLLSAAENCYPNDYIFPLLNFLLMTSCRIGETLAVQWSDVHLKLNEININKSLYKNEIQAPKTHSSIRVIHIPNELVRILTEWKKICPKSELNLVFPNSVGNFLNNENIVKRRLKPLLKKTGIKKKISPHSFRHTSIALQISENVPPKYIQQMAGHSNITTTLDKYGHLMKEVNESAKKALDKIFGEELKKKRKPVYN